MCNAHSYSDLKLVKTLFNVKLAKMSLAVLKRTGRNRCHNDSRQPSPAKQAKTSMSTAQRL